MSERPCGARYPSSDLCVPLSGTTKVGGVERSSWKSTLRVLPLIEGCKFSRCKGALHTTAHKSWELRGTPKTVVIDFDIWALGLALFL